VVSDKEELFREGLFKDEHTGEETLEENEIDEACIAFFASNVVFETFSNAAAALEA